MRHPEFDFSPSLGERSLGDWHRDVAALLGPADRIDRLGRRHHTVLIRRSDTLVVTFESLAGILALSAIGQPLGWTAVRRQGWSSLVFISEGDTWFRDEAVYAEVDRLVDEGFFDGFRRILFYGAGSGGHAAAAYSVAAPGAHVLAIQAQATLDTTIAGWDTRFPQMRRADFSRRYGYAPHMLEAAARAFLVYDPMEREDAMHATLFAASHVTPLRMPGMGAALQTDLHQMQLLDDLIASAATGRLTPLLFARATRARRTHLPYLHRLLRRLERDDRAGLTDRLCRHVTARMDAPRFARHLQARAAAQ